MYDSAKNLPLLASLMVKGVATVATGDPIKGGLTMVSAGVAVAKAFAPDLTEHFISVLDYARFKEFLVKTHPGDLNHDLDTLIKDVLRRAVGFIRRLYVDKLKEESELTRWQKFRNPFAEIDRVLSNMEEDLKAKLTDASFQKSDLEGGITGEHTNCLDELTNYLFAVSGVDEQDTDWQQLRAFFREQLPLMFDLSYKEALKDEKNAKAFRAFEIWILEEGLANQKQLLTGQERILTELAMLRSNQTPAAEINVLRHLEADVKSIPALFTEKLDAVLDQLNRIETTVNRTDITATRTEGKVDELHTDVKKLVERAKENPQRKIPHQLTTIPAVGSEFVGRDKELEQLAKALADSRKVVLMNGVGGIGKTTLAKQFVNQHLTNFDHVCWIDVTKQDTVVKGKQVSGSIREALADHTVLFGNLGVPYNPTEESTDQRFQRITNALRQLPGRNLFVIDNAGADAGEKAVRDVLPQPPNWQVLLTSRQKLNGYQLVPLDKLDPAAAEELFYTYYTYECDPDEVADLLASVDYHTLTVELFARTLEEHHGSLSVGELLTKVQRKALNEPELQRRIETEHHPDETEIFLHLMLAFDCAELNPAEKTLLGQMALLPPEPYTVRDHLAPWLGYAETDQKRLLDETLTQLVKKGWLTQTITTYALHRLIQEIITYQIPFDWAATQPMIEAITDLLETVDNPNALEVYPLKKYGEFLLIGILEEYHEMPNVTRLKYNLGLISQALGQYKEAVILLETVLVNFVKHLGVSNPSLAAIQSSLGMIYKDLGRYNEASELLETALLNSEINWGACHSKVVLIQSNLGAVYKELGRYTEAANLLEKAMDNAKLNYDIHRHNIGMIQSSLGMVYRYLGRYDEAAILLEKSLSDAIQTLPLSHPIIAVRQSNLGLVYQGLGRYEEAIELLETALRSDEKNFGSHHPSIAIRQSNLGLAYQAKNRYAEAAYLMEKALLINEQNFDRYHPHVAKSKANLGLIYQSLGRYWESISLLEEALNSAVQHFGYKHSTVALRQSNLGMAYREMHWYNKAAELLGAALKSDEMIFGPNHPNVAKNQFLLALVFLDLEKPGEAIPLLKKAEEFAQMRSGDDNPNTKTIRSWLDLAITKRDG